MPSTHSWYPSAAACAFIASGIEILSFGVYLFQSARIVQTADVRFFLPPASVYIGMLLGMLAIAVQARALWNVGGIQQAVSPFSARAGRMAVATYVVVSALVFILMVVMMVVVFSGNAVMDTIGSWVFHLPRIALTLAFICLGWASLGNTSPWQRWASGGLLLMGALGILSVIWWLFRLPTGPPWLWLAGFHTALRAATWAAVGAWLKGITER